MVTYEEALEIAKKRMDYIDSCFEYEKAYVFSCREGEFCDGGPNSSVVVLKDNGQITIMPELVLMGPGKEIGERIIQQRLIVNDFEDRIDKEYTYEYVKVVTDDGIVMTVDEIIRFDECQVKGIQQTDPAMEGRKCIGQKNTLTDPKYMKFTVNRKVIIMLFHDGDDFYKLLEALREKGYDMFDLS